MKIQYLQNPSTKCHILAALIIICSAAAFYYQHIFSDGMLFHIDMDFTDPPIRNLELRLFTWDMYGSYMTLSHLQRTPWICLFLLPSLVFDLSTRSYLFLMFMGTLSLVGLNMYLLAYSLARKLFVNSPPILITVGSLIAALVYMFNPVAIQHYWAYWVSPAYGFLPLAPLMAERLFKNPTPSRVVIYSLTMGLFLTTPHFIAWSFLLFISMFGFLSVTTKGTPGTSLRRSTAIVGVGITYLLLNAYWLYPYLVSGMPSPSFYTITPGMIEWLSGDTINIWRLTGTWSRFLIDPAFVGIDGSGMSLWQLSFLLRDPMIVTDPVWIVGGFVLSALSGVSLLRRDIQQRGYLVFFGLVLVVSILLAQGANSVLPFYESVFKIPVIRTVSWVFRVPSRWEFLTALCLAFLSGIAVVGFLTDISRMGHPARLILGLVLALLMMTAGYYFYPIVKVHANTIFKPADIPEDYQVVRKWLDDRPGKVTWFPPDPKAGLVPTWDTTKRYNMNLVWLVEHPTISTYLSGRNISFFNNVQAVMLEQERFPIDRILAILGSRYVIFDQSAMPTVEFRYPDYVRTKQKLRSNPELEIVFETEFLTVWANRSFVGEVFTSDGIVVIDSLDEWLEMPQLNINNSVPVLEEDFQRSSLPASLVPCQPHVPCAEAGESRVTSYTRLSPTSFEVSVRTDKPFLLVVSESYDPLWIAVVDDEKAYTSIPISGIVNGYWIEETGELEIRVEYAAQEAFVRGAKVSLVTVTLSGVYLLGAFLTSKWSRPGQPDDRED